MAIESPLAALSPMAAPAHKHTGKTSTTAEAAPAQGFRALLDGVEATARAQPPADAGLPSKGAAASEPPVSDTSTLPADAAAMLAAFWMPPPAPVNAPPAGTAAMAVGAALASTASGTALDAATAAVTAGSPPLAARSAPPDLATAALTSTPSPTPATTLAAAAPVLQAPALVALAAAATAAPMGSYAVVLEQMQNRLGASGAGARNGTADKPLAVGAAKAVLGTAGADLRADAAASLLPVATPLQTATQLAKAAETMPWTLRESTDTRSDATESGGLPTERLPDGLVALPQFTATIHFESASTSMGVQQQAPEAAIADQVGYWIAQGIQNAELSFDGADALPVQVSISLSGNEAHVEFRTDQPETRELLSGSAGHLKDLLHSEGMVLSGLSVASSGAGGSQARERRAQGEAPPQTAQPRAEEGGVRPAAPVRASLGAVDLFV